MAIDADLAARQFGVSTVTGRRNYNYALNNYLADTSEPLLNQDDQIRDLKGLPKHRDKLPFFVEIVNKDGYRVPLSSGNGERKIIGLRLSVNPSSISVNMAKIVGRTQSMVGWIEEHWGEELDTITFQGSTAAFVTGGTDTRGSSATATQSQGDIQRFNAAVGVGGLPYTNRIGLTTLHRRDSVSYQEFSYLIQILNGNGCEFDSNGLVKRRRFIQISYDYSAYRGYFESIDVTEDANSPFRFTYTVTFKSEKTVYSFVPKNRRLDDRERPR